MIALKNLLRNNKFIITFLFLLNFIFGLLFINEGLFHFDSVVLARAVEKTYATGILHPEVKGRYGSVILNCITYLPFFCIRQNADFSIRFSSILFHSLSIVALFLFINEFLNNRVQAIFASLLLSFTPFYFSPNTYGKEQSSSIFLLLLSFSLLYRGLTKDSKYLVCVSSFIFAFSITVKESMIAVIPLFFLLYFNPQISINPPRIFIAKDKFNPKFILSIITPFSTIMCFAFFMYLKEAIIITLHNKDNTYAYFLGPFSPVLKLAFGDILSCIPLLLLLFFILGIRRMFSNNNVFSALFLMLWVMLLFYFGNIGSYVPRYLDIVIIPIYIFSSYVLSKLYTKDKIISLCILAYFVSSMFLFMYPMLKFRHNYNGEKQFAIFVKEKTEANAIVIAMDDGPFIEYYGSRETIGHPTNGNNKEVNSFIRTIDNYLKNNVSVYLIESGFSYDPGELFKNTLFKNFNISVVGEKLTEDYHHADLKFQTYRQKLFKIEPKDNRAINLNSWAGFGKDWGLRQ